MKKTFLVFCAGILLSLSASAWGVLGHRIVGQLADSYTTDKAKQEIKKILGYENMAMVANWADFIKSDRSYNYLGPWHYVNLSDSLDEASFNAYFAKDTSVNLYVKTNFLISELKNNKLLPADQKAMYMRLLVHMVGDMHQPMHLGRVEDRGGNAVTVQWFNEPSNLHEVWDEKLINFQQYSYTEYAQAINFAPADSIKAWKNRTMLQHMFDTYKVTKRIYAETVPGSKLRYEYNYKFIGALNDQLLKGGIHLAMVVNDIWK